MSDTDDDGKLQVYVTRRGRVVVRRPPRGEPTPAQVAVRAELAASAASARGAKMDRTGPGALPHAAAAVKRDLSDLRFVVRPEEPGLLRVVRLWLRERGYSEFEVELILATYLR